MIKYITTGIKDISWKGFCFMKKIVTFTVAFCLLVSLFTAAYADHEILNDQAVRYISLEGDSISFDCGGVTVSGNVATISAAGVYSLSGKLNDGQILVAVASDEKVQIELNGVDITSLTGPAIYVENADKVTLDIADGTENVITSGTKSDYDNNDGSQSGAAIYAKDDLKIKGHGTLIVYGYLNNGIGSKNDIDIKNADLEITAANNGIKGNDSVEISDANLIIRAGGSAVKTETEKTGKGFVTITGSALAITAEKGISADGMITIVPAAE